ncbi:MAG: hypothetical protein ACYTGQ_17740 [Planctomycetota bacterium]|jgi:hypothetical protein
MRNQILTAALLTGALGLWAAPASAQEAFTDDGGDVAGKVAPGDPSVQGIALSGRVDFMGIYRDDFFDTIFPRSGASSPRGDGFINAVMSLSTEITVMPGLWGVIEVETQADAYAGEAHRAGDDNQIARFRQGFLALDSRAADLNRWIGEAELKVGLMHVRYDVRGQGDEGHPFFLDAQRSENPFTGTPNLPTRVNGTGGAGSTNDFWGGNAWIYNRTAQPRTQEAGGGMITVHAIDDQDAPVLATFEAGGFQLYESGMGQSDTSFAVAHADFRFGKRDDESNLPGHHNVFQMIVATITHEDATIFDYGAGFDILVGPWVEIYGEAHGQVGEYVDFRNAGGAQIRNQHEAWGLFGGMRFQARHHEHDGWISRPFLDVSVWALSGDSGVAGRTNHDFVSMENVNHALILEGSQVGLDIDSNYLAQKTRFGFTMWQMFELDVMWGTFWVHQRPAGAPSGSSPLLGNELDVRIIFRPSDTFRLNLTVANLSYGRFWHDNGLAGNSAYAIAFGATASF